MAVVGQLVAVLTARTGAFERGMNRASKRLARFGRHVTHVGRNVAMLSAVPMALAIKTAMSFETQMAKVATMLDETSMDHLPRLSRAVRQLSVDMGQSSESLTDGLYDILSAQIDVAASTDVLAVATKAGVAGMSDVATATKAVVTMLNAFHLQASEAASVSDLLFALIYRGRGTFEDFAPAIGNVAAIAANAGLSMEEMAAALATMTRAGVETERASTALRATLMSFLKPTEDAKKAAQLLGIELTSDTLRSEGLVSVIEKLSRGHADLTAKIIPTRRALLGLMAILQDTEGYYRDIELMTNRAGKTQEAFAKASDTAAFQVKRIWQGIVNIARDIGQMLLPEIKRIAQTIADNAPKIRKYFLETFYDIGIKVLEWKTDFLNGIDLVATEINNLADIMNMAMARATGWMLQKWENFINGIIDGLNVWREDMNKLLPSFLEIEKFAAYEIDPRIAPGKWTKMADAYAKIIDERNEGLYKRLAEREVKFDKFVARARENLNAALVLDFSQTLDTAASGMKDDLDNIFEPIKAMVSLTRPAALEMGTAGAYTAGIADPVYKAMGRDAANTAKHTKAALPELREIVRVLRNPQPTEVVEIQ